MRDWRYRLPPRSVCTICKTECETRGYGQKYCLECRERLERQKRLVKSKEYYYKHREERRLYAQTMDSAREWRRRNPEYTRQQWRNLSVEERKKKYEYNRLRRARIKRLVSFAEQILKQTGETL